jgi:hypothetical protein
MGYQPFSGNVVALLAKHGLCSIQQKAFTLVNLEPKGKIQYLIVSGILPNLMQNADKDRTRMEKDEYDIGVLFVSYFDGQGS